jgi:hypothetical protein
MEQRFNVGLRQKNEMSPEGPAETQLESQTALSSLRDFVDLLGIVTPALKRWAMLICPFDFTLLDLSRSDRQDAA